MPCGAQGVKQGSREKKKKSPDGEAPSGLSRGSASSFEVFGVTPHTLPEGWRQ
jgi:hypothetical protein